MMPHTIQLSIMYVICCSDTWFGLQDIDDGAGQTWQWNNGAAVTYTNWEGGAPSRK